LPEVLGISPRVPTPAEGPESRGAWRAVIWGLLLIAAVLFGYLYMNTGSVEGAVDQVRNLFSRINSKINRKE